MEFVEVPGTVYVYKVDIEKRVKKLAERIVDLRTEGALSGDGLQRLRKFFRLRDIYNSNAIEGNLLDLGETRLVVEEGLTIAGKSLRDQAEARNLDQALDFLEELVSQPGEPVGVHAVRQVHQFILKGIDDENAGGYRSTDVKISGSEFSPPGPEQVPAQMQELDSWLQSMPSGSMPDMGQDVQWFARAVAAHAWLTLIHPFVDGNGRTARLLMNLLLMRCGCPIAIIGKDDRERYYDALEETQASELTMFMGLVCECVEESIEEYERAREEQREHLQWAQSIAAQLSQPELVRARNEYEVWRNAMGLLKSYARQVVEDIQELTRGVHVYFKDFGMIDFEKYFAMRFHESAKKTWFLRMDFVRGKESARYLLFFGFPSDGQMDNECDVTLFLARETDPYYYERLDDIDDITGPHVLPFREIGYVADKERFAVRTAGGDVQYEQVENVVRNVITAVVGCHFPA